MYHIIQNSNHVILIIYMCVLQTTMDSRASEVGLCRQVLRSKVGASAAQEVVQPRK